MPTYQHHRLGRQGLWPIRRLIGAFWLMATASTCVACVSSAESIDPQAACPPADKVNPLPALHEAAYEGDLGKVKAELKAGADVLVPDARNRTALNLALVQPIGWPSKDPSAAGRPDPEAEARQKAKIAIARALIEAGAPIDIPDCDGMMPLHQLVGFRGPEAERLPLLEAMIEEGAPLAPLTWGGTTPLMLAAFFGEAEIASALIAAGEDACDHAPDGEDAASIAKRSGHEALAVQLSTDCHD